jgi:hypothetical protein
MRREEKFSAFIFQIRELVKNVGGLLVKSQQPPPRVELPG